MHAPQATHGRRRAGPPARSCRSQSWGPTPGWQCRSPGQRTGSPALAGSALHMAGMATSVAVVARSGGMPKQVAVAAGWGSPTGQSMPLGSTWALRAAQRLHHRACKLVCISRALPAVFGVADALPACSLRCTMMFVTVARSKSTSGLSVSLHMPMAAFMSAGLKATLALGLKTHCKGR